MEDSRMVQDFGTALQLEGHRFAEDPTVCGLLAGRQGAARQRDAAASHVRY